MIKINRSKKAFTLIELLVVIAIVGILATLAVIALQQARSRARDGKRVADIKQMHTALEVFYNEAGRYPSSEEWSSGSISFGSTDFINSIPKPPTPADGSCSSEQNSFIYTPGDNGSSYTISFCLGDNVSGLSNGPKCLTPGGLVDVDCSYDGGSVVAGELQWTRVADSNIDINKAPSSLPYKFFSSKDGSKLIFRDFTSRINISSNYGSSWTTSLVQGPSISRVLTASDNLSKIIVRGQDSYLYSSENLGSTWNAINFLGSKNWTNVAMAEDGSTIVAVAKNDYVYISNDFGSSWNRQDSLGIRDWSSAECSGNCNKIAVAYENGDIYLSSDFGLSWSSPGFSLSGVPYITMSSDGAKLFLAQSNDYFLLFSYDFGLNWNFRTDLPDEYRHFVEVSGDGSRLLIGYDDRVEMSTNDGASWSQLNFSSLGGSLIFYFDAAMSYDGSSILTGMVYNYPLYSNNGASSWSLFRNVGPNLAWKKVVTSKTNSNVFLIPTWGYTYKSSNSGSNFNANTSYNVEWASLAASSNGSKVIAISRAIGSMSDDGFIYLSSDSGSTWVKNDSLGPKNWKHAEMSSDGSKIILSTYNDYLYISNNGGSTWQEISSLGQKNWGKISMSSDNSKILLAEYGGPLYISNNSGSSWQTIDSLGSKNWNGVSMSFDGRIMSAIAGFNVYLSDDYGNSWQDLGTFGSKTLSDIKVNEDGSRIVFGGINGSIYFSSDSGQNWVEQTGAGQNPWTSFDYFSNGRIIASASNGSIYISN